jgi:aspartyl aminopeptidase
MDVRTFNEDLFSFISNAPTPYHAVATLAEELARHQFTLLDEGAEWDIKAGRRFVCIRNGSLIAFTIGNMTNLASGFRMIGAHTDSPSLQVKPNKKSKCEPYLVAGVEKYGGALLNTWFDRELSLAGRVSYTTTENIHKNGLIDFKRPLLYIPSLAIHLNKDADESRKLNPQTHVSPVLAQSASNQLPKLESIVRDQLIKEYPEDSPDRINGFDLFCYDPNEPSFFGVNHEFIAGPRLDNLLSCFVGLQSLISAGDQTNALLICSNHEEIGSRTNSGALGNFLLSILSRLFETDQKKLICLHNSFLLSLDNAHASHPNYQESGDLDHKVALNCGPVIKINAGQRYCSTGLTASIPRILAAESGVQCQDFVMRSDMACGSTIGPLTSSQLGIAAVDMGIATWGMHSIREVTGSKDPFECCKLSRHFVNRKTLPPFTC